MSIDKAVDSTQLDADLTSVANAIRTKGGTSAQLAFPAGFVQAIGDIETGGSSQYDDYINDVKNVIIESNSVISVAVEALRRRSYFSVSFPECLSIAVSAFYPSGLTSAFLPKAESFGQYAFRSSHLKYAVFPSIKTMGTSLIESVGDLEAVDLGNKSGTFVIEKWMIYGCSKCSLIILRPEQIVSLNNVDAFEGNTPFASGKAGGTIYIPKVLYDHLGDRTALDYQSTTNWSTVHARGTITWAQIEGSIYETQYADGTPITT